MMKIFFLYLLTTCLASTTPAQPLAKSVSVQPKKETSGNKTSKGSASVITPSQSPTDPAALFKKEEEVLFATNEDCDLYINEKYEGIAAKSNFKYLKLPPGTYWYKAISKKTPGEVKESFRVQEGGMNEIFIDLLYAEDERKAAIVEEENKKTGPVTAKAKAAVLSILSNMVTINGGNFTMGNNKAPSPDEVEHKVTINTVRFSKYEVTQQQWESIMGSNPSLNKGCNTCPVENVSWEEAMKFIRKLNLVSNKKFRLPTEAEWEYVARKGGKQEIDKAGGPEAFIKSTAWYFANAGKKTHPVGLKQPNVSGVYDLFGNVAEWCSDWYGSYYYKEEDSQRDPEGPPLGKEKIVRGGSFTEYAGDRFRPSLRMKFKPTTKSGDLGFRLVLDAAEPNNQL